MYIALSTIRCNQPFPGNNKPVKLTCLVLLMLKVQYIINDTAQKKSLPLSPCCKVLWQVNAFRFWYIIDHQLKHIFYIHHYTSVLHNWAKLYLSNWHMVYARSNNNQSRKKHSISWSFIRINFSLSYQYQKNNKSDWIVTRHYNMIEIIKYCLKMYSSCVREYLLPDSYTKDCTLDLYSLLLCGSYLISLIYKTFKAFFNSLMIVNNLE